MKFSLGWVAALMFTFLPIVATAQDAWPTRPLRLVVAFPPGTPNDIIARLIAPDLQQSLGQPVVVENKSGASGNVGMAYVVRSSDEHSVLVGPDAMITLNPHLFTKLGFKPTEDLVPVTQLAVAWLMLVCHPGVPVKTLADLLALAKERRISYASGGPGSPGHMTMEMLLAATQAQMTHVPYRGPAPAMQDILGGIVACGFLSSPVVAPLAKEGKLIALAVSGPTRLANASDVPTVAESGVPGFDASVSEMVAMPKATPAVRIQRLQQAIVKALAKPEMRARLQSMDMEPLANSSEDAERRLIAQSAKWGAIAARIGLQLD